MSRIKYRSFALFCNPVMNSSFTQKTFDKRKKYRCWQDTLSRSNSLRVSPRQLGHYKAWNSLEHPEVARSRMA
jgi:hypothetical protein